MRLVPVAAVLLVAAATLDAADTWLSLRSEHFQLIGNSSRRDLREVALRFEQFREVVTRLGDVGGEEAGAPVAIFAFRDTESFEPFMPRAGERRVPVAGMFVSGPDASYIAVRLNQREESFRAAFHEYAHLLLQRQFGDAPLWFSEGIAEYYSTMRLSDNRTAMLGFPIGMHITRLRQRTMPLTQLFGATADSPEYTGDTPARLLLYAQAWALVHHAFHAEPDRRRQIHDLAGRLSAGGDVDVSVQASYGLSLSALQGEVQGYVHRDSFKAVAYNFRDDLVSRVAADATPMTDAEADAWLGDLLAQMGRRDEARARLERALQRQPDLARAHDALARLSRRTLAGSRGFALSQSAAQLAGTVRPPGARPFLRITLAGEGRSFGRLEALECQGDLVEFVVRTADGTVRARGRFGEVAVSSFRVDSLDDVLCGPQSVQLPILLTWKAAGPELRQAVAVEFVPDGFVP